MKNIDSRSDIEFLVESFYEKIRADGLLGPIFEGHLSNEQWTVHLVKLVDFWETNLFGVNKFKGNPTQKHIQVDNKLEHGIEHLHFGKWLQLWFETIDAHFEGTVAIKAKESARKMAAGQYISIWNHRNSSNGIL